MRRIVNIFLLGVVTLCLFACGGPQKGTTQDQKPASEAKPAPESQTTSNKEQDTPKPQNSPNKNPDVAKEQPFAKLPNGVFLIIVLIEGGCIVWLWRKCRKLEYQIDDRMQKRKSEINGLKRRLNNLEEKMNVQPTATYSPSTSQAKQSPQSNSPLPTTDSHSPQTGSPIAQPQHQDSQTLYLDHHGDGFLTVVDRDKAYYQVEFVPGQDSGKFEFIGNAMKAIKNKNAILDDVCEATNSSYNASQIHTVRWGTCVRQPNGRWKVTEKAKISFK